MNAVCVSEILAESCLDAGRRIHLPQFVSQIFRELHAQMCIDERTGPLEIGCMFGFENKQGPEEVVDFTGMSWNFYKEQAYDDESRVGNVIRVQAQCVHQSFPFIMC